MNKKKVVFLGSKPVGYSCFEYLLQQRDALQIEVAGLLTQERKEFRGPADLTVLAEQYGVPVIADLNALPECDLLYSVQYHRILNAEHIARARQAAVNLHMAPLPEYRGSNQFAFAIIDGKKEFGTTIHLMDTRIDHGDILFQRRFEIPKHCWVNHLYELTVAASVKLFRYTLKHLIDGNYTPVSQASLVAAKGTSLHYRHEIADLKRIDLNWDAEKISRHVRATMMPGFEPPYCEVDKQKVYFTKAVLNG
ncbi:MAG: formyltransferase family protein [Chitinophagaceae bacterium]